MCVSANAYVHISAGERSEEIGALELELQRVESPLMGLLRMELGLLEESQKLPTTEMSSQPLYPTTLIL